jgi:hypothetical protein
MKKSIFGVCRECYKIRKYENIDVKKASPENTRIYTCPQCVIKKILNVQEQKNLFAL